jgi:hypothetical protein
MLDIFAAAGPARGALRNAVLASLGLTRLV